MALDGARDQLQDLQSARVVDLHPERLKRLEGKLEALGELTAEVGDGMEAAADSREEIRKGLDDLSARIDHQNLAIAEGIERVTRAENRINNTVQRARKELRKRGVTDEGLEAEDAEIRLVDADRSDERGVYGVPGEVGGPDDAPSTVPGITVGQLRRARGMQ